MTYARPTADRQLSDGLTAYRFVVLSHRNSAPYWQILINS